MAVGVVDLRSDTVTRPSLGMRKAMAEAQVGDDVFGEDPTVKRLEAKVADLLGKEAALFVPSGTMANQVAIRAHTEPGDEIILEARGHSFAYESGGMAALAGVQAKTVPTEDGLLSAELVEAAINPAPDHFANTKLVIVENTSNAGGGTIYSIDRINDIAQVTAAHGLALHMDGARLWNAHVATGVPLYDFSARCASVSVCLSKGLGAPVGSLVAGSKPFIDRCHRYRKMYGGGMRQVGILAQAGLYALEHNLERMSEDHEHLRTLAKGLSELDGIHCDPDRFPTNIAYVDVVSPAWTAASLADALKAKGVLTQPMGPRLLRVVTHLEIDATAITRAIEQFGALLG